ncbi:MAG: cytochrome c [Bacteroidia bacterium]|jgi:cytochrome c
MKRLSNLMIIALLLGLLAGCGGSSGKSDEGTSDDTTDVKSKVEEEADPMENKGIGPISAVTLGDLDQEMADLGGEKFKMLCSACHKIDKEFIGPSLQAVLDRRSPEWVMNVIMNPEEMIQNDPIVKQLLIDNNMAQMANQAVSEEDARAILGYFLFLHN